LGSVRNEARGIWNEARSVSKRNVSIDHLRSDAVSAAWYVGLGSMTALRVIEWRLAAVIAAAHTVERYGRRQFVREMVGGLDAGV
jgi:hypothetical protein